MQPSAGACLSRPSVTIIILRGCLYARSRYVYTPISLLLLVLCGQFLPFLVGHNGEAMGTSHGLDVERFTEGSARY